MAGQRIDYIDYLKGLSITWVVWYHTVHPWFVDFSFRIPLFFLASGIFFKVTDFGTYVRKKTKQLLIPFAFFTLIYYGYLLIQQYVASGSLCGFDFWCIFGVFEPHAGYKSFAVNPPLWFICALICQQLMTWILVKTVRNRIAIFICAVVLTVIGAKFLWNKPTLFMFGRSLPYLVYYVSGYLFGKDLLNIIERRDNRSYWPLYAACAVFAVALLLKASVPSATRLLNYFETFGLVVMLIYLFRFIHTWRILRPLHFFGRNSYIVLGMHEIYQTVLLIAINHMIGPVTVWTGMLQTTLTLLLLYPTIKLMNRYVPQFVGKA